MFWVVFCVGFLGFMAFMVIRTKLKVNGWDYRFRKDKEVYYFEDGKLILNASYPQNCKKGWHGDKKPWVCHRSIYESI